MLDACGLDKPFRGRLFNFIMLTKEYTCSSDRRQRVRAINCLSKVQDKGLNANPTCKKKTTMSYGFLLGWKKGNPICSKGKQHRKPDTTYMFVRDYSVVLIRLTMLQNIQTGGGFKAVIGGTYTGKTLLNHF